jgi:hypothetical protein
VGSPAEPHLPGQRRGDVRISLLAALPMVVGKVVALVARAAVGTDDVQDGRRLFAAE